MCDKSARTHPTDQYRPADTLPQRTLVDRLHFALGRAGVELARPADLVLGVGDHFVELGDPADRSCQREDRREQGDRDADRALDDAGIEVDVRVELACDEVLVLEGDLLQRHRQLEDRIVVQAERVEDLVAGLAHELGARVVVLVDPVPEAHQLDA